MRTSVLVCGVFWLTACGSTETTATTSASSDANAPVDAASDAPAAADASPADDAAAIDGAATDAAVNGDITANDDGSPADTGLDTGLDTGPDTSAPACPGAAGCPCTSVGDCDSGFCLPTADGKRCAALCSGTCPVGFTCATAPRGGDLVNVCVPLWPTLCDPCSSSAACKSVGTPESRCVDRGADGSFCGAACQSDTDCPGGYNCAAGKSVEGQPVKQCQPTAGQCACSAAAIAASLETACHLDVKGKDGAVIGQCLGSRSCGNGGLTACSAQQAASDTCNGEDDDCNGQVDDGACDDGKPCTADSCDAQAKSCLHTPAPGSCDADGNACTEGDACQDGKCTAGKAKNCDDGNVCTLDACLPASGCTATLDDGAPCSDGDGCTLSDTCSKGVCTAGYAKTCTAADACKTASCLPADGSCKAAAKPDGEPCSDGSACTAGDGCKGGACVGSPLDCSDGNPCTLDACEPDSGCTHQNANTPCDDGSACTTADACKNGGCIGLALDVSQACNDGNGCTSDGCEPKTGCTHAAHSLACDDGSACTVGDGCSGGSCVAGKGLGCDDGNPCTLDGCDPKTGCTHAMLAEQVGCGANLWCIGGQCVAKPFCGDGKVNQASETCDDGNVQDGDGCSQACKSEGAKVPLPGQLVITEVMPDPAGVDDASEWFEVYNPQPFDIALTGLTIKDNAGAELVSKAGLVIKAGSWFWFGSSASVDGLAPDYAYNYSLSKVQLSNSGDEVSLWVGGVLIDSAKYGSSIPNGKLLKTGVSLQLSASKLDATANDDGANWCYGTAAYGTSKANVGTPGGANAACP